MFLKIRDRAQEVMTGVGGGDSWDQMACVDRLVELNEIEEIPRDCWAQYKVYSTPQRHNY